MSNQAPTNPTVNHHPYTDALSRIHNTTREPEGACDDLDRLCMAAQAAQDAHMELEYQFDHAEDGPAKELLRVVMWQAYDTWQNIERVGLPLLHQYERETLGYSDDELTPATE